MSVCRLSARSDVYVFYNVSGGIDCCRCRLLSDPMESFNARDEVEMIAHLHGHKAAGHKVPQEAFDRLANPEAY
jgi:hypothetical protein